MTVWANVASRVVKLMIKKGYCQWRSIVDVRHHLQRKCPDVRNTKIVIQALAGYGIQITIYDRRPCEVARRIQFTPQGFAIRTF
jgi:hypothetical protein